MTPPGSPSPPGTALPAWHESLARAGLPPVPHVASHLLIDTLTGAIDAAVVISNDSDLAYPIAFARERLPVGLVNPTKGYRAGNHWWYQLTADDLRRNQLPDSITPRITKPMPWRGSPCRTSLIAYHPAPQGPGFPCARWPRQPAHVSNLSEAQARGSAQAQGMSSGVCRAVPTIGPTQAHARSPEGAKATASDRQAVRRDGCTTATSTPARECLRRG